MYRFVVDLLQPSIVFLVLTGIGLANLWLRRRETRARLLLVTVPFLVLLLIFTPAVSHFARGSLEWHYAEDYHRPAGVQAIVILGGHVSPPNDRGRRPRLGWDSYSRCLHALQLYLEGPPCPVIVTGGKVDPQKPGPTIAEAMCDFLVTQGIPEEDLVAETRSTTTFENALETRELLQQRGIGRIVIVTDATHLIRAENCFRAQGLDVTVSGCNFGATEFEWSYSTFLPNLGAAGDIKRSLHEWLGILYYWLRGRFERENATS